MESEKLGVRQSVYTQTPPPATQAPRATVVNGPSLLHTIAGHLPAEAPCEKDAPKLPQCTHINKSLPQTNDPKSEIPLLFDRIIEIANTLKPFPKSQALRKIALAHANAGDIHAAKETACLIQNPLPKSLALIGIAVKQAEAEDIDEAKKTAYRIELLPQKALAFKKIALIQADANGIESAKENFWEAVTIVKTISDTCEKSKALLGIAEALAGASDIESAKEIFLQAKKLALATPSTYRKIEALKQIA